MAAPVIANITTLQDVANTTSRVLLKPLDTADGDWLIYIGCIDGTDTGSFSLTGFTQVYLKACGASYMAVFVKLASGEGVSYTVGSASEQGNHYLARITGSSATTAAEFVNALSGSQQDDGTYVPSLLCYASTTDTLILRVCGCDASSARSITDPGSHTSSYNNTASGTASTSISVCYTTNSSPAYIQTAAFTLSGVEQSQGLTIALASSLTETYPDQPVVKGVEFCQPELTTALTYPKPWNTVDDDLLFLMQLSDTTGILTAPGSISPAFTSIDNTSNTAIFAYTAYRVASSEGTSYTASGTTSSSRMGMLARVVNADAASPINQHTVATGSDAAPTASTLTPGVNNCLIITGFAADDDDITNGSGFTATWTAILGIESVVGSDTSFLAQLKAQTTATSTGAVAMSVDATEEWIAFNVAIAPGTSGTTYNDAITETASATDSSAGVMTGNASVTETSSATDALTGSATDIDTVTETANATDDYTGGKQTADALAETATAADSVVGSAENVASLEESTSATDVVDAVTLVSESISESVMATDNFAAEQTYEDAITESATAADTYADIAVYNDILSESASATDAYDGAKQTSDTIAETATAADSYVDAGNQTYEDTLTESVSANDNYTAVSILFEEGDWNCPDDWDAPHPWDECPDDGDMDAPTGPGDDDDEDSLRWRRHLAWLKRKKRRELRKRAKTRKIPEKLIESLAERAEQEVLRQEVEYRWRERGEALQKEVFLAAIQRAVSEVYEQKWAEMLTEFTEKYIREQEDEELFFMVM